MAIHRIRCYAVTLVSAVLYSVDTFEVRTLGAKNFVRAVLVDRPLFETEKSSRARVYSCLLFAHTFMFRSFVLH